MLDRMENEVEGAARPQLALDTEINAERLAEEIEAAYPQLVEGLSQDRGVTTITPRANATSEQIEGILAIARAHDAKQPSSNERRAETTLKAQAAMAGVDYKVLMEGVKAISNAQIKAAFVELLKLNYRLAAAAGFIVDTPEGFE